ncbi:unnamed protein product [Phaeothamnion confervicola]
MRYHCGAATLGLALASVEGFVIVPGPVAPAQSCHNVARTRAAIPTMSVTLPPQSPGFEGDLERRRQVPGSGERLTSAAPPIQRVSETEDFLQLLGEAAANGEVVVVKYYARFCRACKAIAPRYERLALQYAGTNLKFVEVEFEASKPLCKAMGIKSLPHTHVFVGSQGKMADFSIAPSKFERLEGFVADHMESATTFKIPVPAAVFETRLTGADAWGTAAAR